MRSKHRLKHDLTFYRLPFEKGTRILTTKTLKAHYPALEEEDLHWNMAEQKFTGELLIYTIRIEVREICTVYMKIDEDALLVACSHGTTERLISKYAASVIDAWCDDEQRDFEYYYWPDVYGENCGKYMIYENDRSTLRLKPAYRGLYRPGAILPQLTGERESSPRSYDIVIDTIPRHPKNLRILGFCLGETESRAWHYNHHLILKPFSARSTKDGTSIRTYDKFISDWSELSDLDYSPQDEELLELCFLIRENTELSTYDQLQDDADKFRKLLGFWHRAWPLFLGRIYKKYVYVYGRRHMKGKPEKGRMMPCAVNHAVPGLVFLWKDKGEYFSLKIRVKIFNKLYHLNDKCYLDFFVTTRDAPSEFLLLSTVDECRLVRFFNESHFQMIILKSHYTGEIVEFVERLRQLCEFRG